MPRGRLAPLSWRSLRWPRRHSRPPWWRRTADPIRARSSAASRSCRPACGSTSTARTARLVGLGSYLVNTTGCNDCHTHPAYAPGGDPFARQPEQINAAQYLAGGRTFPPSPFVSANITPDFAGLPAGLTREEFIQTLRTGHNPKDPPGEILQIMPWPVFGKKTDRDLSAIYEFLRAIPSLPNNPNPGPEP